MFHPQYFNGNLRSWEYFPAAAGTYKNGQMLNVTDGLLAPLEEASTEIPPYICQCDRTVKEGEVIPVVRVSADAIYHTTLSADAAEAKIGTMLQISAGGEQVDASAEGSFEVVGIDDTKKDSVVYGRFITGSAASGAAAAGLEVATDQEVSDALDEAGMKGD